jgi:hypothetical protein
MQIPLTNRCGRSVGYGAIFVGQARTRRVARGRSRNAEPFSLSELTVHALDQSADLVGPWRFLLPRHT